MTTPKWLIPVLAIVAALAVGVAATLIGLRFLPQETLVVEPGTVVAPILEPAADDAPDDAGLTELIGSREVTEPGGEPSADDPAFDEVVERVGSAWDAEAETESLEREAAEEHPETDGDACAPREGDPPAGCPDGVMGTIFALTTLPALTVGLQVYPPTREEYDEVGNPIGALWCPAESPSTTPLGAIVSRPAQLQLWYSPSSSSLESETVELAEPANVVAWEDAFPDAESTDELPTLTSCVEIGELLPDTVYNAYVIATAADGSRAISNTVTFNSNGEPHHPSAQFRTLGQNWVFARGLYTDEQHLSFRAWILDDEHPDEGCDAEHATPLSAVSGRHYDVSERDLLTINAPLDYDRRLAQVYRVPEGANVLFCARWTPRVEGEPSWERERVLFESHTVLQAPDRILPLLTLRGGSQTNPDIARVDVTVATAEGVVCGETTITEAGIIRLGEIPLCDPALLAGADAHDDGRGGFWSFDFSGDLSVTTTMTLSGGGEPETTTFLIPASRWNCFGACDLPSPRRFPVPIGEPEYDCGSSTPFALNRQPCFPIEGTESGSFNAILSWTHGYSNGVSGEWGGGVVETTSPEWVLPDRMRMNVDHRVEAGPVDPETLSASATFRLETDRSGTYSAQLFTLAGGAPCTVPGSGATTRLRGDIDDSGADLEFVGLCLGAIYKAEISLLADDGSMSIYSLTSSWGPRWGINSVVATPRERVEELHYEWNVAADPSTTSWTSATFRAGSEVDRFTNSATDVCSSATDPFEGAGSADARLGSSTTFRLEYQPAILTRTRDNCTVGVFSTPVRVEFEVDLVTLLRTGEQNFTITPSGRDETIDVRVWVDLT